MREAIESEIMIADAQAGSEEARQGLIEKHTSLLWSLAYRLAKSQFEAEELVQAGCLGLLRAVERYDQQQGVKLTTYAVPWILGEMKRVLREMYDTACKTCSLDRTDLPQECSLSDQIIGKEDIDFSAIDLRMAIRKLNSDEQLVVCLRYFRDKTQKETAELLGKSQTQISRLERAALDRLKELLS